jgi:uncharacterized protein YbaA (DUF1428 family)
MKRYIDGFVLPVPKQRLAEYQAIAEAAAQIWKEHGALEYSECVGDDLNTESRQARDAANEKIIADPRMAALMTGLTNPENPIVDFQRMAHGGFKEIVRG